MNIDPDTLRLLIVAGAFVCCVAILTGKTVRFRSKKNSFDVGDKSK